MLEAGFQREKYSLTAEERWSIWTDPTLDAAVHSELLIRVDKGSVIAQSVLEKAALSEEVSWNVRVAAAKELRRPWLEHHLPHLLKETKDLSDLSIEELRALVSKLEATAGDQAKPILPPVAGKRPRGRPPKRAVPVTLDLEPDDLIG